MVFVHITNGVSGDAWIGRGTWDDEAEWQWTPPQSRAEQPDVLRVALDGNRMVAMSLNEFVMKDIEWLGIGPHLGHMALSPPKERPEDAGGIGEG